MGSSRTNFRYFSTGTTDAQKPSETSIFDQVDFYQDETVESVGGSQAMKEIPWFDSTDSLNAMSSVMPKDLGNVP
jgi:hypothetical protein